MFSIKGKYFYKNDEKFLIKGVSYGVFAPEETNGTQFMTPEQTRRDFQLMREAGVNTVRIYLPPPDWFMEMAAEMNLAVIPGIYINTWEPFLENGARAGYRKMVRDLVRQCKKHDNTLAYLLGNEIPQEKARELGLGRIEKFIQALHMTAKEEDPNCLTSFSTFPPTEFLNLDFLDFSTFNIYIYRKTGFRKYISKLQNRAGTKPLLLGETGADSLREGETWQAELLKWKIRAAFELGCGGAVVYTFCDGWWDGIKVLDWQMGIVNEDRTPKKAFWVVREEFNKPRLPFEPGLRLKASVVVCAYNEEKYIAKCINSLLELNYPNKEIIVVDDGSTDRTAEIAREFPVQLIQKPNGGLSSARNVGWKASKGDIVAYTDADCEVDPDWLTHIVGVFEKPEVSCVGGPNITPADDPFVAQCIGRSPGIACHVLIEDVLAEHVPGCNMAFRRIALEEIGGFDERYRIAGDDLEIGWRLQDNGGPIHYHAGAQVFHHRRVGVKTYWKQQYNYGLAEAIVKRHHPHRYRGMKARWLGKIYGPLPMILPELFKRPKIYFQPFPYMYHPNPGLLYYLPLTFIFYFAWAACLLAAPFNPGVGLVGLLMALVSVVSAFVVGVAGTMDLSPAQRAPMIPLIALFTFMYPAARGLGQILGSLLIRLGRLDNEYPPLVNGRLQSAQPRTRRKNVAASL